MAGTHSLNSFGCAFLNGLGSSAKQTSTVTTPESSTEMTLRSVARVVVGGEGGSKVWKESNIQA